MDVKDGALTGAKIADGGIGGPDLADGSVGTAELARGLHEPLTLLNGGENDCVWTDASSPGGFEGRSRRGYRRSLDGEVSLEGAAAPMAGPGGDATCDGTGAEGDEDSMVLTLPAAATPANSQIFVSPGGAAVIIVAGVNGLSLGSAVDPAGNDLDRRLQPCVPEPASASWRRTPQTSPLPLAAAGPDQPSDSPRAA